MERNKELAPAVVDALANAHAFVDAMANPQQDAGAVFVLEVDALLRLCQARIREDARRRDGENGSRD